MKSLGIVTSIAITGLALITALRPAPDTAAASPVPTVVTSGDTALVITDPQNDFLSPDGVTWDLVGANVTENNTVENIDLVKAQTKTVETTKTYSGD